MLLQSLLFGLLANTISSVPAPGHFFPGYHGYGYHGYHPKCTTELEAVTKTLCRVEYEKECETKTKTFTKITGYEDTDCKEIELKKPVHHGYFYHKREAEAEADAHGYAYEKVTKTICKKTPITEEVSKDFELCRPKPSEVCEEKEIKVPRVVCEEHGEKEAETDVESI